MSNAELGELQGALVLLRAFNSSNITEEYVSWLNDPQVVKYSNQRFVHHTEKSCRAYLASFYGTPNSFLLIQRLDSMEAIGTMTAYVSEHHQTVDIGIMIGNREAWGKGFGRDSLNTLVSWFHSRPNIRKITGGTMRANAPMMRLFEQSGMVLECVRPKQELLDGMPQDLCYFAKYNEDR